LLTRASFSVYRTRDVLGMLIFVFTGEIGAGKLPMIMHPDGLINNFYINFYNFKRPSKFILTLVLKLLMEWRILKFDTK